MRKVRRFDFAIMLLKEYRRHYLGESERDLAGAIDALENYPETWISVSAIDPEELGRRVKLGKVIFTKWGAAK